MDERRNLIEKIRLQGLPSPDGTTPLPVVSLADFFNGNDDMVPLAATSQSTQG